MSRNVFTHPVIHGSEVPLLLFTKQFDRSKYKTVTNMPYSNKPDGGLWTSPYKPDTGSEWVEFTVGANFNVPNVDGPASLITLKKDATIYRISAMTELCELLKDFKAKQLMELPLPLILDVLDYERLAKVIDGIYVTPSGLYSTRLTEPSLHGWDCETVLILNVESIKHVQPGRMEKKWLKSRKAVDE